MLKVLTCLTGQHDFRLVLVAGLVCFAACFTAFRLFSRLRGARGLVRGAWLLLTGLVAGSSVWATHFIAMVAYTPGLKLNPFRERIQHMEVQVASLEDLTQAYQRCIALGLTIAMDVGQHANDRAVSFYVKTPSGFELECGWNPVEVDDSNWVSEEWNSISAWGHKPVGVTVLDRVGQLGHSLASIGSKEFIPG